MKSLFAEDLNVVNVGLQGFADNIVAAGGSVIQLSWAPPVGADAAPLRASSRQASPFASQRPQSSK